MDLLKPCMICKKKTAITRCAHCGIFICNDHTDKGYCLGCIRTVKGSSA